MTATTASELVGQIHWLGFLPSPDLACRFLALECEGASPSRIAQVLGVADVQELALARSLLPLIGVCRERAEMMGPVLAALRASLEGGRV